MSALRRALLLLVCVLAPGAAAAQVVPVQRDTLAPATAQADSARPAVPFPAFPSVGQPSFAAGEWVYDREALLREAPISLTDLLERIPAMAGFRAGMFVQPEAASAFGLTAGRVIIEIDGYELDPLTSSTLDLSVIPLVHLREVRVQRRLGLLRIRLRTDNPDGSQPLTRVEAGVGIPAANLFRGLFLVPYAVFGPLSLAIERVDTDGTGRNEPADIFTGWGKWSWNNEKRGVQLEINRSTLRRDDNSPWPVEALRQDIILRARNEFIPGLTGEVFGGTVSVEETAPAATDTVSIDREGFQAGLRAGYVASFGSVAGAFRYRDVELMPTTEAVLEADVGYGPVRVGGEFSLASWEEDLETTSYFGARASLGPFLYTTAFAEITGGDRGAPVWADTSNLATGREGWRAGLTMTIGRATGSIAAIGVEQGRALPLGLPFDTAATDFVPTEPARGIEAFGRFQIIPRWLAIESWIVDWQEAPGWAYLPTRFWRTSLELHALPLASGNLEILARGVATQRSAMLGFASSSEEDEELSQYRTVPAWTTFSGYLQIRIIDVRAFIRWDDAFGADIESLPGRFHQGPRIFYGVKWNLWN